MLLSSKFFTESSCKKWKNWSVFSEDNYGQSAIAYIFWATLDYCTGFHRN